MLLIDLRAYLREVPAPLPEPIAAFLEGGGRTFYGMGLKHGAARLAFEFDTVIRCVDFNVRTWPALRRGGGIYGVYNRYISSVDLWRHDNLDTMSSQARHAYLQWSVAHYFMMFHGPPHKDLGVPGVCVVRLQGACFGGCCPGSAVVLRRTQITVWSSPLNFEFRPIQRLCQVAHRPHFQRRRQADSRHPSRVAIRGRRTSQVRLS